MNTADLVQTIEQKGSLPPTLREAFLAEDRAIFVPTYYQHVGAQWVLQEAGDAVYEDTPLTTQITNNLPSSSSSMPSVMAAMLEALDVEEDMEILEIGTGTGYNAALLSRLVGETGKVTSIDIDGHLADQARMHLQTARRHNVAVWTEDGHAGYANNAPYDRIIVTASFRAIPAAWIAQLALSGILVGNVLGALSTVILCLESTRLGNVHGRLLPYGAFFMELHHGHVSPTIQAPNREDDDAMLAQEMRVDWQFVQALKDQAFLFFLQGHCSELQLHWRIHGTPEHFQTSRIFIDPATHASATIRPDGSVEARGDVFSGIVQTYERYVELGSPRLCDYGFSVKQGLLFAHIDTEQWPVCPCG